MASRTRCTRRSVLVNVPLFSAKLTAGRTTSANWAVSVRKMSCTTRKSDLVHRLSGVAGVGFAQYRVLPDDVERVDTAGMHGVEYLGVRQSRYAAELASPRRLELGLCLRGVDGLIARVYVGQAAHIAGPLHIVLSPQWVDARRRLPEVPGEQREVADSHHVAGPVNVLGDPHAVDDGSRFRAGVAAGGFDDVFPRHPRDPLDEVRVESGQGFFESLETLRPAVDEGLVVELLVPDHPHHAHEQRDVRAGSVPEKDMGEAAQLDLFGIGDDQLGAVPHGALHLEGDDGMGGRSIRAYRQNGGSSTKLGDGVRHGPAAKHCGQTGHRRSVS